MCSMSRARRRVERDACSAGFSTIVHPVARTGPIFSTAFASGAFQGTMEATTPTGSFTVQLNIGAGNEFATVSPWILVAAPA